MILLVIAGLLILYGVLTGNNPIDSLVGIFRTVSTDTLKKIYADWKPSIDAASLRFNIPKQRIIAIIAQESGGKPDARGLKQDIGLMQVTPPALADFNRVYARSYSVNALLDPAINIEVGTGYLAWLKNRTNGDLDLATRAYNVGLGNILQTPDAGSGYLANVLKYESQVSLT